MRLLYSYFDKYILRKYSRYCTVCTSIVVDISHTYTMVYEYLMPTFLVIYQHPVIYRGGKVQYTVHGPQSSSATEHCPV